jgi:nanoRNase/pAp phosphatase (c-di-AMP/oligoRNAs hydrolase)
MNIVTSHSNTDFDALASMVAASFLYPDTVRVLPGHVQAPVREFLAVHWDLLQLQARKDVDLAGVKRLIVTDTSSWNRLDNMQTLSGRDDLETVIWDHHLPGGTIEAGEVHREEVGAAVTLLLEEMKARDCAFPPMHATLFLLGIYDDTGSLSFPSSTARDAYMAGFLLENGADLNVAAAYLQSSLDSRHVELFSRMLAASEILRMGSLKLGVCVQDVDKSLNMLPSVVSRYKEIEGLDAAFGVFPMSAKKTVVIGRGNGRTFDVGDLVRRLGGGGHAGAGSATVEASVEDVYQQVVGMIQSAEPRELSVRCVMSPVTGCVPPAVFLKEAKAIMGRSGRSALLVVDDSGKLLGSVGQAQLSKIKNEGQWEQPVTSMICPHVVCVSPDQSLGEALNLMGRSDIGFLPVVENQKLVGQVTRAALIFNMYDF